MKKTIELLSPCQDFTGLQAALQNGANAVYFGLKELNLRVGLKQNKNFALKELNEVVKQCHAKKVRAYLTVNSMIFEKEIPLLKKILKKAKQAKVDAVIAWDFATVKLARKNKLKVHLSTQASISNSIAINEIKKLGVKRIVLARELSLNEIKELARKTKIELEVFCHGARCVSVSGRCYLSNEVFGEQTSSNKGKCLQICRRSHELILRDKEFKKDLVIDENAIIGAKDLCSLPFLDKIVSSGITSIKIEGRNKPVDYIAITTKVYRQALDAIKQKKFNKKLVEKLMKELELTYNKGFGSGFYFGLPSNDSIKQQGNASKTKKTFIGKIIHVYSKIKVVELKISSGNLKLGDKIEIIGPKTGCLFEEIKSIQVNHKPITKANKGSFVGIRINGLAREKDEIYKLIQN